MPQAPEITPEMYAEFMAQQQQQIPQEPIAGQPAPQGQQMSQEPIAGQPAPQGQPMQQSPQVDTASQGQAAQPEDEVAAARQLLGLDQTEQTLQQLQSQLAQVQEERVRAELSQKYPDVPFDIVEKEIEKVAQINPQFADSMKRTPEGMDMAYRAALAAIKPKETPDNLTQGEGGGAAEETIEKAIKTGKANDIQLGDFILSQTK